MNIKTYWMWNSYEIFDNVRYESIVFINDNVGRVHLRSVDRLQKGKGHGAKDVAIRIGWKILKSKTSYLFIQLIFRRTDKGMV